MRIVLIGCVEFSQAALDCLLSIPEAKVVGVVTRAASTFNNDFCSLAPTAQKHSIPVFFADQAGEPEMRAWMEKQQPDLIYCFGWSYLLKKETYSLAKVGAIGFHPAALPRNRGRHPLIWALALGLKQTASSFFFLTESADAGDLISQKTVEISDQDDAASLYAKVTKTAVAQIREFTLALARNNCPRQPQDSRLANEWRKRGKKDGEIDWRMPSQGIYNLVRALTHPYVGAHVAHPQGNFKVWQAVVADGEAVGSEHLEPGKILAIEQQEILVKCGSGAVRLRKHELPPTLKKGDYL